MPPQILRSGATHQNLSCIRAPHQRVFVDGYQRFAVVDRPAVRKRERIFEFHLFDVKKLTEKLQSTLKEGDWLIICGSVPAPLGDDTYENLLKSIKNIKNVNVVVDACGKLLTNTLKYRPFLIKPNIFELSEIFGLKTLPDPKQIAACARTLQKEGARNVIVSMGSDGAIMVSETDQSMYVRAARGQLVNSVGAGDSMIAGFVHEYLASGNYFSALNYATAAGSACAFTQHLATREQIEYIESLML